MASVTETLGGQHPHPICLDTIRAGMCDAILPPRFIDTRVTLEGLGMNRAAGTGGGGWAGTGTGGGAHRPRPNDRID